MSTAKSPAAAELYAHLRVAATALRAADARVTSPGVPNVGVLDHQITQAGIAVDTAIALMNIAGND